MAIIAEQRADASFVSDRAAFENLDLVREEFD
jgi:hypothetical protein